ncbi:hypothetical protein C440_05712 [Haloferax mucosum ATCC BAA-1512]|uniref:Uncharacterized protein n=1 Tax=Haloferax mucosum ATCC BAA-1512 TaxID=662479 RepID=M0IJ65_9EURY|nr:hypothetical protein C440_05712 [Haloferax mucosum ATCC BAA-1512]
MRRRLYTLTTRDSVTLSLGRDSQRNTAALATLSQGTSVSKSVSLEPGEIPFEFFLAGERAGRLAASFSELLNSDEYSAIPFYGVDGQTAFDGYYVPKRGSSRPLDAQVSGQVHRVNATLSEAGTRRTHLKAVTMEVSDANNDHGNNLTSEIAIPSAADTSLTRWLSDDGMTTVATPTTTRTTQFGAVDIYNTAAAPTATSTLIYGLPYTETGKTDCRVWDDRGVSKLDANDNVQWQRVFATAHEFVGRIVVENGLVRLTMDDRTQTLTAETWDDVNQTWSNVSLGTSDWVLVDVDLVHLGPVAVEAQLLFEDPTGGQHAQDMRLTRGSTAVLFENPMNETDATPVGLQDLLEPVASTSAQSANESLDLVDRKVVRK